MKESRFMIRIWQEEGLGDDWYASLKDLSTKEVRYFSSLQSFWQFFSSEWLSEVSQVSLDVEKPRNLN